MNVVFLLHIHPFHFPLNSVLQSLVIFMKNTQLYSIKTIPR